ncbi:hypothetical protein E1294_39145 [Nonomuraea diastatica]|uniref:Tn3 transposase DDE domain-containing protein n=1 Tax=Nonomuraea diastatica TaxID=1848329 RepID=A0A4R4W5V9_9ACTN|nr:hypothetical protein E1294_39145 [Nonomuraea diastatica]
MLFSSRALAIWKRPASNTNSTARVPAATSQRPVDIHRRAEVPRLTNRFHIMAKYLSDPAFRRKISRQWNKGESLQALRRDLHYAQQGTITRWCLTLLTNPVAAGRPNIIPERCWSCVRKAGMSATRSCRTSRPATATTSTSSPSSTSTSRRNWPNSTPAAGDAAAGATARAGADALTGPAPLCGGDVGGGGPRTARTTTKLTARSMRAGRQVLDCPPTCPSQRSRILGVGVLDDSEPPLQGCPECVDLHGIGPG